MEHEGRRERAAPRHGLDTAIVVGQAAAVAGERPGADVGSRPGTRLAVTGVVLGGLSVLVGLASILGWPLGLAAIVVAGLAVKRGAPRRGVAVWGTWLGLAGSVLSMLVLALQVSGR